jgi:hypothetical protein
LQEKVAALQSEHAAIVDALRSTHAVDLATLQTQHSAALAESATVAAADQQQALVALEELLRREISDVTARETSVRAQLSILRTDYDANVLESDRQASLKASLETQVLPKNKLKLKKPTKNFRL